MNLLHRKCNDRCFQSAGLTEILALPVFVIMVDRFRLRNKRHKPNHHKDKNMTCNSLLLAALNCVGERVHE